MGRYNLLREPWITVVTLDSGIQKNISLLDLFSHAEEYQTFAGDMETQDFAVLRLLLSVLHTVFSRFDASGEPYFCVKLDEKMRQLEPVDEDDLDEYIEELEETWTQIWKIGAFPEIVCEYLKEWGDHFNLFDENYPFFQCTAAEMEKYLPPNKKASPIAGRNIKRIISESGNKKALFSPETDESKDRMSEAELARWLIMLQGYTGLSDKTSLFEKNRQPSKGWLFDIGGLYLEGNNLFETLMLNYIPVHSLIQYRGKIESPCWELENGEVLNRQIKSDQVNSLAELYTNWSRAIVLDPNLDMKDPVMIGIAKLPAIQHTDQFLEPMTVWRYNQAGDAKDHFTPRKHLPEQQLWRSFGLITLSDSLQEHQRRPEILRQYDRVRRIAGNRNIAIRAVSMKDDGNATSWVPTDEIIDVLHLNDIIITDNRKDGWVVRINSAVEDTKKIVEIEYGRFLTDIVEIRGMDPAKEGSHYISIGKKEMYQQFDSPFRKWIEMLVPQDSIEAKLLQWNGERKKIILNSVQSILDQAGERDYRGVTKKDGSTMNIVTSYLSLMKRLRKYG